MTEEVKTITDVLSKNKWVTFAYLFGSRARGVADERSDWDIAVCFSKAPDSLPGWAVFELEAAISNKIMYQTQIIALNNLDSPVFVFQIINDGIVIVDKKPDKRFSYETLALNKYHDWRYFLTRHMDSTN